MTYRFAITFMALGLAACSSHASAGDIQGAWRAPSGNVDIRIAPCGPLLCGEVIKVLANNTMQTGGGDSKAAPPTVGLKIFTDLKASADGPWVGHIYNRENGKTYDCQVSTAADGALQVRIYVGVPALGKTQVWTPAKD